MMKTKIPMKMKNEMKKIFILMTVAVMLSGCGIYTKYQRPANITVDKVYGESYNSPDTANLGQMRWQDIFTDVKLQHLIESGLQNNRDIRVARLRVEQAEAALTSSRLAFLPSVAFNPQGTVSRFYGATNRTYQIPIAASWQIDAFGSLRNAKARSKAQVESSYAYRQAVQTQLIATVATCYYQLLLLDKQLKISEETAAIWEKNVATMKRLMEAGVYNDAAVSRSEASHNRVKASVLDLKQQIRETENSLSVLLGKSIRAIDRGTIGEWQTPSSIHVGVPLSLLSQRPDVTAAENNLAAAFYATNEARAAFYPTITLSGSAGWTNSLGSITNPAKLLLDAVGSLMQPVFQNGRLNAQLKIARASQEEAKLNFQQTLLNAGMEVNNALTQVQTFNDKSVFYDNQINSLVRAVKSTDLLMDYGSSTYLEVLSAQEELLSAQLTQITNRYNEISSIISLYQALGGGN
jgi:NodT family efflux transporter outer membrane factor (OMF) lipoprotein